MTSLNLTHSIIEKVDRLPFDLQRKVLDFAQALSLSIPKGIQGKNLLQFAGTIEKKDLVIMEKEINKQCEKVDSGEW